MKLTNFFKEVGSEIKKITWPTRQETIKYTLIVIGVSVIVAIILGGFDFILVQLMDKFIFKYRDYLPQRLHDKIALVNTAHEKLHVIATELSESDYKIYLLIDEYDNFTNTLLTDFGEGEYKRITRQAGYFKQFFTNLKLLTSGSGSGLARLFITGVSPVTMDDVTSGFNIGDNID